MYDICIYIYIYIYIYIHTYPEAWREGEAAAEVRLHVEDSQPDPALERLP